MFLSRAAILALLAMAASVAFGQGIAPLPEQPVPLSSHAPYVSGDCQVCHANADPKNPGPVAAKGTDMCLRCHEELGAELNRAHVHRPARRNCTACHNPHNAKNRKLLVADTYALCTECHADIATLNASAKVPHKALTTGSQCMSCHEPHGSAVAGLLVQPTFDLCVDCHSTDTMVGADGRKLQNIKAWLDANKNWHGPVAARDCSSCHAPHGGDYFRLLTDEYPPEFYAPYDARAYALCFSCHREKAFSTARTTTLTGFRDGDVNLHYLHLQQDGRGRTCRACHEVHASQQAHHVREGVPFGRGGWVLELNFKKTPDGGSCARTCHTEKSYVNVAQ